MPAIRTWYVIVSLRRGTKVTFTQTAGRMVDALALTEKEMMERFTMNPHQYEFLECGIKEG